MTAMIKVPGSKSITQRALVIAALADNPVTITGALDCDDSRHLSQNLRALGVGVSWDGDTVGVTPARLVSTGEPLYCGNAGTAMRFGSCLSLATDGPLVMDGDKRMRERPIGPLGAALEKLGVQVDYLGAPGCPPIRLLRRHETPGEVGVDSSLSSQFASGLMLVAPGLAHGLRVILEGEVVSTPYINMTVSMMRSAGAAVKWDGGRVVSVSPGSYRAGILGGTMAVEPDWSGAAFILAAAFITGLELEVEGLTSPSKSLQGDSAFAAYMEELKKQGTHAFDLTGTPDLIAPLAAAALFAGDVTKIRGAAHTRVKESDRIAILTNGFRKFGAKIIEHPDGMDIEPLVMPAGGKQGLEPANDHRMAMAFGIVSLKVPGIEVSQKGCVSKSFPGFWQTLESIRQMNGKENY